MLAPTKPHRNFPFLVLLDSTTQTTHRLHTHHHLLFYSLHTGACYRFTPWRKSANSTGLANAVLVRAVASSILVKQLSPHRLDLLVSVITLLETPDTQVRLPTEPIFSYEDYFRDLEKTPRRLMYFFCSSTGFSDGVAQAKLGDRLVFSVDQSQHLNKHYSSILFAAAISPLPVTEISTSMRPLSHHAPNLPSSPALWMVRLTVTILISFRSASTYQRKTPFE